MKYTIKLIAILVIFTVYFMSSCTDKLPEPQEPPLDCSTNTITYDDHVYGILESSCNTTACHDNSSQGAFGAFSTLSASRKENIATRVVNGSMPPGGNVSSAIIDTIRCWQENGYLEN